MRRLALLLNCLLLSSLLQAVRVPLFGGESPPASTSDSTPKNKKTGKYYVDKIIRAAACNNTTIFDQKITKYLHAKKQCNPCLIIELAKNPEFLDRAIQNGLEIGENEQKAVAAVGNIESFEIIKKHNIPLDSSAFWWSGNQEMAHYLAQQPAMQPELRYDRFLSSFDTEILPPDKVIHAQKFIFEQHPKLIKESKQHLAYQQSSCSEDILQRYIHSSNNIFRIKRFNQLEKYIITAQESADVTSTTTS